MRHNKIRTQEYSEAYKDELFQIWFKNRRPSGRRLLNMIPEDWADDTPTAITLTKWITGEGGFNDRAVILDRHLQDEIEGRLIQEKVEMLYRHGELGRKMQNKALEKLDTLEPGDLSSSAAVRLLVEGVKIERESVGLPQALEKMMNATDEELLDRVEKLIPESQAEILVIEDDTETD